jgi:SAM-dependent methyltransferase
LKLQQRIIENVADPAAYRRRWRKARRLLWPLRVKPLLANLDQRRLREIQSRYAASDEPYAKYANVNRFWRENRRRVQDLRLHRCSGKRILDLGCGGGFFLYLLKQLGHDVLGLDVDKFPLFRELVDLLDVPRVVWRIEAFKPLPDLGEKFDYITAFATSFNRLGGNESEWGAPEWEFLLTDLHLRLKPGGRLFFTLNRRHGQTDYFTAGLREFFLSRGALLERERISFPNGVRSSDSL